MALFKKKSVELDPKIELEKKKAELAALQASSGEDLDTQTVEFDEKVKSLPKGSKQDSPLEDYLMNAGNAAATLEVEKLKLLISIDAKLTELLTRK